MTFSDMADAVVDGVENHPYLTIGGFAGLLGVLYLMKRKSAKPAQFQFTYGPSDTNIKAGTALAIAQAGNQSALSRATLQADTAKTVYQDYFGYLAGVNNNNLALGLTKLSDQDLANQRAWSLGITKLNNDAANNTTLADLQRQITNAGTGIDFVNSQLTRYITGQPLQNEPALIS
jgi:hypothetical protein